MIPVRRADICALTSSRNLYTVARGVVTLLFQSAADITPEYDKGILRARILVSAKDSDDVVAAELFEELNRKKVVYPGANLRLVCELPPNRAKRSKPGSNTLQ